MSSFSFTSFPELLNFINGASGKNKTDSCSFKNLLIIRGAKGLLLPLGSFELDQCIFWQVFYMRPLQHFPAVSHLFLFSGIG